MIAQLSLAGPDLTERLQLDPAVNKPRVFHFTPGELEELIGHVAAEANHAGKKAQTEWDALHERMVAVLDRYSLKEERPAIRKRP